VIQAQALGGRQGSVLDANNNMVTQFRLYDHVSAPRSCFAQQYTVPTPDNWRRVAHKVADDI